MTDPDTHTHTLSHTLCLFPFSLTSPLQVYLQTGGKWHIRYANTLEAIANLDEKRGHARDAVCRMEEAAEVYEHIHGQGHQEFTRVQNKLERYS